MTNVQTNSQCSNIQSVVLRAWKLGIDHSLVIGGLVIGHSYRAYTIGALVVMNAPRVARMIVFVPRESTFTVATPF